MLYIFFALFGQEDGLRIGIKNRSSGSGWPRSCGSHFSQVVVCQELLSYICVSACNQPAVMSSAEKRMIFIYLFIYSHCYSFTTKQLWDMYGGHTLTDGNPLSCSCGNHSTAAAGIANVSPPQTHYCRKVAINKKRGGGSRSLPWWWGWWWFCRLLITAAALAVWNPGTEGGAAGLKGWLPTLSCARPHSQSATTAIWLSLPGPLSAATPLFRHPPFSPHTHISGQRQRCMT